MTDTEQEPFSIEVGDIIRHKGYPKVEYEVLEKGHSGTNVWYRLRSTDGSRIPDLRYRTVWRNGGAMMEAYLELAETAIRFDCEKWAMKKVRDDRH